MADLEYSIEARNILNVFYGVERVVYVEGEDDIAFGNFYLINSQILTSKQKKQVGKKS